MQKRLLTPAMPANPLRVVWEMSSALPVDAIVITDSGHPHITAKEVEDFLSAIGKGDRVGH